MSQVTDLGRLFLYICIVVFLLNPGSNSSLGFTLKVPVAGDRVLLSLVQNFVRSASMTLIVWP